MEIKQMTVAEVNQYEPSFDQVINTLKNWGYSDELEEAFVTVANDERAYNNAVASIHLHKTIDGRVIGRIHYELGTTVKGKYMSLLIHARGNEELETYYKQKIAEYDDDSVSYDGYIQIDDEDTSSIHNTLEEWGIKVVV
ncbi:hypothetical protein [Thermoactinomyces sp. DSM 45892]|uniref:hypothetical protein n=1 Tax=Thermoactinomyces sp. DSM 45892 TaxID=1882753 RepID=UPI00089AA4FC|nr:hypothetical protein [Thermoactinomyces sp. DSM 45892]SDY85715.1 hypothetical protein SAMN05444416_10988 [Thermoactinomyces sp. DSM 45892]